MQFRNGGLIVLLLASFVVPAAAGTTGPSIVVDPTAGPTGSSVHVSGREFFDSPCGVNVHLDSVTGPFLGFASVVEGSFGLDVTIPDGTLSGEHSIVAEGLLFSGEFCGEPSGERAVAPFFVEPTDDTLDRTIRLKRRTIGPDCGIDPDFVAEIRRTFDSYEIRDYLENVRRVGPFGHVATDEEVEFLREAGALQEDPVEGAEEVILVERIKEMLLA